MNVGVGGAGNEGNTAVSSGGDIGGGGVMDIGISLSSSNFFYICSI